MSRWRIILIVTLTVAPLLFLAGVGSYYLWVEGWALRVWWPMAACMALGYGLGWYWQHKKQLLRPPDFAEPIHWTERDQQAWRLVEARAKSASEIPPANMTELNFYVDVGKAMAVELANFYHPKASDPVAALTIPEILAVVELASHDLAEMVDQYLPGGHLLTIRDWRRARQIVDWYPAVSNLYWIVSAIFSPFDTAARFTASKVGLSGPFQMLQNNLLIWFYTAYVHRLGTYLVDLNSGRLRLGAQRYRELMRPGGESAIIADQRGPDPVEQVRQVTLTFLGQVKVGKSSFVNALLGEQRAAVDVLPATDEVTKYELRTKGIPTTLQLLDTVGYGRDGPKADQLKATQLAAKQSDLLVLVLHARNPAREPDLILLRALRAWFLSNPDLKMPPIVAVLTHIDLLSPAMEWSPPYNWRQPRRPKEQNMAQAVAAVQEQLGDFLTAVVPVCALPGKTLGVEEDFLPALAGLLDEVHAVAFLRCLRAEIDANKMRKVFYQLLQAGKEGLRLALESMPR
jgi:GTP-binding protein EngB required for normal cell division